MIIESIVTTVSPQGQMNPAPMGITLLPTEQALQVRPYKTTHTYQNLLSTGVGVVNLSYDGSLFVYTAVGDPVLPGVPAEQVPGTVLVDCSWWEIEVERMEDREERALFTCRVVQEGQSGVVSGFNRAQAALVEGAILASRPFLYEHSFLNQEMDRLAAIITKTGGPREREALSFLLRYLRQFRGKVDGTNA